MNIPSPHQNIHKYQCIVPYIHSYCTGLPGIYDSLEIRNLNRRYSIHQHHFQDRKERIQKDPQMIHETHVSMSNGRCNCTKFVDR